MPPACPNATSPSCSACTCRAGCRWRSSSPSASGSRTSKTPSTRSTPHRCCARWWCSTSERSRDKENTMNGGPIGRVVTHGVFELDGGSWEVDNNIWVVGDDSQVVVFDAAHDAGPIVLAVGGRPAVAVVCTHGHNDHVTVAPELGE